MIIIDLGVMEYLPGMIFFGWYLTISKGLASDAVLS
jgi:hypothetical protein